MVNEGQDLLSAAVASNPFYRTGLLRAGFANAAQGELVVTNLGRIGRLVIRSRLGDRVQLDGAPCGCGRT